MVNKVGIAEHMVAWSLRSVDVCWAVSVQELVDFLRSFNWLGNSRVIPTIRICQGDLGQQNIRPCGKHNRIRNRN